jgi:hypothetical protein
LQFTTGGLLGRYDVPDPPDPPTPVFFFAGGGFSSVTGSIPGSSNSLLAQGGFQNIPTGLPYPPEFGAGAELDPTYSWVLGALRWDYLEPSLGTPVPLAENVLVLLGAAFGGPDGFSMSPIVEQGWYDIFATLVDTLVIPEPASTSLIAAALAVLAAVRCRLRRRA